MSNVLKRVVNDIEVLIYKWTEDDTFEMLSQSDRMSAPIWVVSAVEFKDGCILLDDGSQVIDSDYLVAFGNTVKVFTEDQLQDIGVTI